ncbi:phenylalanine--tRNA ligase subunit alpha, partial [Candidatus Gottesmanbacteria bacterium]|nr:phenylalanine--tRNA ligase subunit alpha [Candidatus Gottesmanbacteria bacterium]
MASFNELEKLLDDISRTVADDINTSDDLQNLEKKRVEYLGVKGKLAAIT